MSAKPPHILLAPMEGVVDPVIRELYSDLGGYDEMVTEFVRVTDKLNPDHIFQKYSPELLKGGKTKAGTPVALQLLGGQPQPLAENADAAIRLGAPAIDLNFGCPAKTVNRHDGGATLLKKPERLFDIVSAVKRAADGRVPVCAKVRLGFEDKSLHKDIARAVNDAGAARLVIHARTKVEGYKPPAHWEYMAWMAEECSIPVYGNGDIWSVEDYQKCVEVSGLRNVALGRGAMARPNLALQIKALAAGKDLPHLGFEPLFKIWIRRFAADSFNHAGEKYALNRTKQWTKLLGRNYDQSVALFESIKRFRSYQDMSAVIHQDAPN